MHVRMSETLTYALKQKHLKSVQLTHLWLSIQTNISIITVETTSNGFASVPQIFILIMHV